MARYVTPEETYQCLRQWSIIDVRPHDRYNQNHIPGARWMNWKSSFEVAIQKFEKNEKFVLYDEGDEDNRAEEVAAILESVDFTGISILQGGYTAWAKNKYPSKRPNEAPASQNIR